MLIPFLSKFHRVIFIVYNNSNYMEFILDNFQISPAS